MQPELPVEAYVPGWSPRRWWSVPVVGLLHGGHERAQPPLRLGDVRLCRTGRRDGVAVGDGAGQDAVVLVALATELRACGQGEDLVLAGAGAENRQQRGE